MNRLGKIKVGIKGDNRPKSIDWFRGYGEYAKLFHKTFGDKPTKLQVIFPYDDVEQIMNEMYRNYKSGGLFCIGEGVNNDDYPKQSKDGTLTVVDKKCPCESYTDNNEGDCKIGINMNVIVIGMPVTGVWAIETASFNTRTNIRSALTLMKNLAGRIAGVPFWLSIEMTTSSISGSNRKFPVIQLVPDAPLEHLLAADANKSIGQTFLELSGQSDTKLLPVTEIVEDQPEQPIETVLQKDDKPAQDEQIEALKGKSEEESEPETEKKSGEPKIWPDDYNKGDILDLISNMRVKAGMRKDDNYPVDASQAWIESKIGTGKIGDQDKENLVTLAEELKIELGIK